MSKTKQQLAEENRILQLALEDVIDIVEHPQRYHLFIDHRPSTKEANAPGLKGAKVIHERAKSVLSRSRIGASK